MKKILHKITNIQLQEKHFPLVLLGVSVLAYGLMIGSLGFYWDDWEILYLSSAAPNPSDIFLFPFRPLHVWLDIATVHLLGFSPLSWHLLMFMVRYLGALIFWYILREIWPGHPVKHAWGALLFVVYPSFLHQSMAVVYRQHFSTALFYLLSIFWMVRAFKLREKPEKRTQYWVFLSLSLLTAFAHLFLMEYFAGLELWRPAILLFMLAGSEMKWGQRLKTILKAWWPYLLVLAGYVIWRIVYVQSTINDPNQTVLLQQLAATPLDTLILLAQTALKDTAYMLVTAWSQTAAADLIDFSSPAVIAIFGLTGMVSIALYFLMQGYSTSVKKDDQPSTLWLAALGLYGMLLGLAPAWLIGQQVIEGRYSTRFSIPALAGASLIFIGVLFYLIPNQKKAAVVFSVLIALGVGMQLHMSNEFRWDWERQTRLYWQLYWRAPALAPNTALLTNKSATSYATTYPIAYAVNILYEDEPLSMQPDYWWFEIYESNLYKSTDELVAGGEISKDFHHVTFETNASNSLLVNIPSAEETDRCIWILTPQDVHNKEIDAAMQELSALSNTSRIITDASQIPSTAPFGNEPQAGWCTYFQKASLAAQQEDWDEVMRLYQQAKNRDLSSLYGYEYWPFLTAAAAQGDWALALQINKQISYSLPSRPMICSLWDSFGERFGDSADYQEAYTQATERLNCAP